ncbi:MAG: Fur family transcriptional regulator [Syntrophales bacterium]
MVRRFGKSPGQWCHGKFRDCGYRMTVGREAVLDVLSQADEHLSAEDIYMRIHPVNPAMGLTSIYRTLDILVNIGLVHKFDFGHGRARYELAEDPKGKRHHHHLVCTGCGRVIDYTDFIDEEVALLKKTEEGLSKKYNFRIDNHLIQFYGLCDACNMTR